MLRRGIPLPPTARKPESFAGFQRRYRDAPAAFVADCLTFRHSAGAASYQLEILEELVSKKRMAVRSPHGAGKTSLAAWLVLWATLTADDCKVPTTASSWRQLTKFLWPEIWKWSARVRWDKVGRPPFTRNELLRLSLHRGATCESFAVACASPETIEGAHAQRVAYVYDEAKAIPAPTFDATEGAFSGAGADTGREAFALAISTPGAPAGRFYDICSRKPGYEDWSTRHVTLKEAVAAGRISGEWVEQRKRQWGEESAVYQNRVLGQFCASEEEGIIPLAQVEAANELWHEWKEAAFPGAFAVVGVDVARSGSDKTVLALRYDAVPLDDVETGVKELRRYAKEDTMATTGRVAGVLAAHGGKAIVDVIGIGAGVVDRLREQHKPVVAFNAAVKSRKHDRSGELGFVDTRSAAWWNLREMLEDGGLALPPDENLTGDLTFPHWRVVSGGKIRVESKDDLRKPTRLGRSTDAGDAVVQAFWPGEGGVWVQGRAK